MLRGTQELVYSIHQKQLSQKYQTPESFIIPIFLCCSFFISLLFLYINYQGMLTKLPKIAKITLFLHLSISSLLLRCCDIEKNPGPKYSSLTLSLEFKRSHGS